MDLTDEQWVALEPLLPKPPKRADGRGRPWRDTREVLNGVLWVLRTGAPGTTYPNATRPTRPATAASKVGCATARWGRYSPLSPKKSRNGED